MAQLVILTGDSEGRRQWAEDRARAYNWDITSDIDEAGMMLADGSNVVLDNDLFTEHDVTTRHFRKEREYKPYSKEEEN